MLNLYRWTIEYDSQEECSRGVEEICNSLKGIVISNQDNHRILNANSSLVGLNVVKWTYKRRNRILQINLASRDGRALGYLEKEFGRYSTKDKIFDDDVARCFL